MRLWPTRKKLVVGGLVVVGFHFVFLLAQLQLRFESQFKEVLSIALDVTRAPSKSRTHFGIHETKAPFTYAFVLGGIDPIHPTYRGILYSIYVAVYALRTYGSNADVVLFVQSSHSNATVETFLTFNERRVANDLAIQLRYLHTAISKGFHEITMNKFIILNLTEYEKVLFLDADVLPLNNLDYLFHAPVMKSTFSVATAGEPANAGLFLLSPGEGDYEEALNVIERQRVSAQNIPGKVKFDMVKGWGHVIEPPDEWESTRTSGVTSRGTNWTFYCAPSDQGFLYYWTKYLKKDTSIMVRGELKNWGSHANETVKLESKHRDPFRKYSNDFQKRDLKRKWYQQCEKKRFEWECLAPHRDYVHLAGTMKPWRLAIPEGAFGENRFKDAWHYWFYMFHEVNEMYGMGVDFENWENERLLYANPPLGWKPDYYPAKCTGCKFW